MLAPHPHPLSVSLARSLHHDNPGVLTFSYLGLLRMNNPSHAEQLYLMHRHYCKGRLRVGVGVDVNKHNLIGRTNIYCWFPVLDVSLLSTTANITRNYCMCITVRVGLGVHINKT